MDIEAAEKMGRGELWDYLEEAFGMKPTSIIEVVSAFVDQLPNYNRKQFAEAIGWKPPDVSKKLAGREDAWKLTTKDVDIICSKFPALHSSLALYHTHMAEEERSKNGLGELRAQYRNLCKQMKALGKNLGIEDD